jgi:glycosyltransferase involved in cell wall biosynthesis
MKRYTVCVYAICKDEAMFADRWMDSMSEADLVVVTDTGSSDQTVEKLRSRGAIVHTERVHPWRFDAARNLSLDHVPEDADICVCTDLDEYFTPGWRERLEAAWRENEPHQAGACARMGRYLYNWRLKPDGSPDVQFHCLKVHDRTGFRWRYPVHEHIKYEGRLPLKSVFIEGMVLNHAPDPAKSRSSYLPLLELAVSEDPSSDRMRYYLGREYMYGGAWQKCIDTLTAYLALPNATWNEERCAAMRHIASSFRNLGRTDEASRWFFRAIAEAPHMREPYVEFAWLCYKLGEWPMVYFLSEAALAIPNKSATYINMGYAWDATPSDLSAVAAFRLGLMETALERARAALAHAPDDPRLRANLRLIEQAAAPAPEVRPG